MTGYISTLSKENYSYSVIKNVVKGLFFIHRKRQKEILSIRQGKTSMSHSKNEKMFKIYTHGQKKNPFNIEKVTSFIMKENPPSQRISDKSLMENFGYNTRMELVPI